MDAATYDWMVTMGASATGAIVMFLLGLFLGFVCWGNSRKLAADRDRELEARERLLAGVSAGRTENDFEDA